jgi:hypothetical protein
LRRTGSRRLRALSRISDITRRHLFWFGCDGWVRGGATARRLRCRRLYFGRRRLRLRRSWIRSRLNRYYRSSSSGRIRRCNRRRGYRGIRADGWLRNESRPGVAVTLPVPRQQSRAHDQQKQGEVEAPMAARRLVFQQIVQVARALIPQPQKRRAAHRNSSSFASQLIGRRWRSKGSPTHAAEAILRIILLTALHASYCHGYRHHYTNSDANSARPFGMPPAMTMSAVVRTGFFVCFAEFLRVLCGNGFDLAYIVEKSQTAKDAKKLRKARREIARETEEPLLYTPVCSVLP